MTETEKAYIAGLFDGEGCVPVSNERLNARTEAVRSITSGTSAVRLP